MSADGPTAVALRRVSELPGREHSADLDSIAEICRYVRHVRVKSCDREIEATNGDSLKSGQVMACKMRLEKSEE